MLKIESLPASLIEGTAREVGLAILMHLLQALIPASDAKNRDSRLLTDRGEHACSIQCLFIQALQVV